jgi:hypothetical protein
MLYAFSLKNPGFPSLVLEKINHFFLVFLLTGDDNSKVICGTAGIIFF